MKHEEEEGEEATTIGRIDIPLSGFHVILSAFFGFLNLQMLASDVCEHMVPQSHNASQIVWF